ncbi:unnamed protein product [Soboliphyme baturini]|uniref:Vacuolar protein sorting-associated protein 52 homolog n=1 Tax=Soboliphyme baturini TaxID=241478 RepID=A0A183IWJ6_9BILA|nr:unnamed protein product [Soboliphyme baturini]
MEQLHELKHKLDYLQQQDANDAICCVEAGNILEFLKIKVVEKIREFLLKKIYLLRKPMANYQILDSSMLKYRFYFEFLVSNDRRIADEIRGEYADTMSKVLFTYFRTYIGQLMKLQLDDVATKDDLLGADDSSRSTSIFSTRQNPRSATVFTLGTRASVIEGDIEAPIIVPHTAMQNSKRFHFEVLFRSAAYALLDNACREYVFLCDFFMVSDKSAFEFFNQVMCKAIMIKNVETHVSNSFDCIALTLCVRIVYHFQALAIERHVTATDGLWEALLKILLSRLNFLFKINAESLRNTDIPKLLPLDKRPHYIIRRYAEFYAALRDISSNFSDAKLQQNLNQLENEVNTFLMKCAKTFNTEKDKLVFYINNYDVICTIVSERIPEDQLDSQTCRRLLYAYINEYVELQLGNYFGDLVRFVNICEPLAEQSDVKNLELNAGLLPSITKAFNSEWKQNIERINQEIMTSFSNFRNGTAILQNALTLLIHYHQRFQKLISLPMFASSSAKNKLVNIHHLKVEMRKYKPTF